MHIKLHELSWIRNLCDPHENLTITRRRLSIFKTSSSFKCLDTHTFVYATPALITEVFHLVTQVVKAAFNKCYSQIMAYTALAYSYWVSFHDTYVTIPRPCPLTGYRLRLLYNSCRYCLTNHIWGQYHATSHH